MTTAETAWAEAMKFENRADPYPFFDELRKTPVARVADNIYVVTGYRELLALAHDPRISSDLSRSPLAAGRVAAAESPPGADDLKAYGRERKHHHVRSARTRSTAPSGDAALRPTALAGRHSRHGARHCAALQRAARQGQEQGETRLDVVDDYAYPVPVAVICKILGVPLKDEPTFHGWIYDFMAGLDLGPGGRHRRGAGPRREGPRQHGRARAVHGRADRAATSESPARACSRKLVNDDGPDGPMSPKEAATNAMLLLVAGHDSTVNTIANCVMTLLRNPGSLELVRRRPELIPRRIEEVLRLQSAVQFFPSRSATADIEIAGTVIPKGSAVHLMYGAANRDPTRFPDPNRFDPERRDNEHFGWGSGIHTCMGGPLARLEVNLALETFLRRVENPRLVVDPPPYRQSKVFRGPRHLMVDFDRITD